jgi:hypothetical protein
VLLLGLKLTDPSVLLLVVLAVTAGFLLLRTNRYFARQKRLSESAEAWPTPRQEDGEPPSYAQTPHGVVRWEVEMHETARRLTGQLDSKLAALEALVAEADRAAARLEAAIDVARLKERTGASAEPSPSATAGRVPSGCSSVSLGGASALLHPEGTRPAVAPPRPSLHEEVYALADYGYDVAEIARRIGSPVGEVELILTLRGKS